MSAIQSDALFAQRMIELRPALHRYCARMSGSVIDGEDIVQDALVKAIRSRPPLEHVAQLDAWLFRVTHNAAIDFLRKRSRERSPLSGEDPDMIGDPAPADAAPSAAISFQTLMRLPVVQRSSVILKDVLGYSVAEIAGITAASVPSIKAALNRGRSRLRGIAGDDDDRPLPALDAADHQRLTAFVDRFNARDFGGIRDMLAGDVRLELVNRGRISGPTVRTYFGNYADRTDWQFAAGRVDGQPAVVVCDPDDLGGPPRYFILLEWAGDRLSIIRDFFFARYVMDGANVVIGESTRASNPNRH